VKDGLSINIHVLRVLLLIQGIYFILTGLWPLAHIQSFMYVTGPKTDIWLVKMVGLLAASIGIVLLGASRKKKISSEIFMLVLLPSLSFAAIDSYYSFIGRISAVYLLDACAEIFFVIMFSVFMVRSRRSDEEMA
jgi:hypothetical protein